MTQVPLSRLTALALVAAMIGTSGTALAYGSAAPMGVRAIEAQAPVTSVNATTSAAPAPPPQPARTTPASRLRLWLTALRQRADGAIDIALH